MIKKQLVILLVLILVSCGLAYGLNIGLQEPSNGYPSSSYIVKFKCVASQGEGEILTNITLKLKSGDVWYNIQTKDATNFNPVEFTYTFPVGGAYFWNCLAKNTLNQEFSALSDYSLDVNVNNPPIIKETIPNQQRNLTSGAWTFNLVNYKTDDVDSGSALIWSVSDVNTTLLTIDIVGDMVFFTPNVVGSDVVKFILTDSGGLTNNQNVTINILGAQQPPPTNTAPSISGLPDKDFTEGSSVENFTVNLNDYASDSETADAELIFNFSVEDDNVVICSLDGHSLVCEVDLENVGSSDVIVGVSDGELTASDTFSVSVNEESSDDSDDDSSDDSSTTNTTTTTTSEVIILTSPSPSLSLVNMKAGESKKFKIDLKNPVSDVVYNWFIDEVKIIGAGDSSYDFNPEKEGKFELKVVAKKEADSDFYMWTVEVGAKSLKKEIKKIVTDLNIFEKEKINFKFKENSAKTFTLDGNQTHKISLSSVSSEVVIIKIESEPIEITLSIGETEKVDIDGDGVNDIKITLNSIENSDEADITIVNLMKNPGLSFITGFSVKEVFSGNNKYYVLGGIIFVLLIVVFSLKSKKKKKNDLVFYGKKEGFFKRIKKKLADRELKRRERKKEKILIHNALSKNDDIKKEIGGD